MRVKVVTPFRDVKDGRLLKAGQVITVAKDRGERMIARGLVAVVPRQRKKARKPSEDKAQRPTEDKAGG